MKPIQSTNDFVIKFANVNGSGSASANELFAKAIGRPPILPRLGMVSRWLCYLLVSDGSYSP